MDFTALFQESMVLPLSGTTVRIASIDHLIAIERAAGRRKDLDDVER